MRIFFNCSMIFQVGSLNVMLYHKPILGVSNVYRSFQLNVNSVSDFLHRRKMQQDAVFPSLSMGLQDPPSAVTNDSDDDHYHRPGEHSKTQPNKELSLPQLSSIFPLQINNERNINAHNFWNQHPLKIKNSYEKNWQKSISEKSLTVTNELSRNALGRMLLKSKSQPIHFERFDTSFPLDNSQKLLWSVSELCCSHLPARKTSKETHNSRAAVNDDSLTNSYLPYNKFEGKSLNKTEKYQNQVDESEETDSISSDLLFPWEQMKSKNAKEGNIFDNQGQRFDERKLPLGWYLNKHFQEDDCEKDEKEERTKENNEEKNNFKLNDKVNGKSSKINVKKSKSKFNTVVSYRFFPLGTRSWTNLYQNPWWKYGRMLRHWPWIRNLNGSPKSFYIK